MDINEFLIRQPWSRLLDAELIQSLARELVPKALEKDHVLFCQGEPADALYILLSGKLLVNICSDCDPEINKSALPGEFIGEMGLLTGQPRTATVRAAEDSQLLCLPKASFERLSSQTPDLISLLARQVQVRFQWTEAHLMLTRLFGKLDEKLLTGLLARVEWQRLHSGEVLFRQGDPGDAMYIVLQGHLRFAAEEPAGTQRTLGEVVAGEPIGEFALIAEAGSQESRRTATVYATRLTDLLVFKRPLFNELIQTCPSALLHLTRQIVSRSAMVGRSRPRLQANMIITLVPVRTGQRLEEFARYLTTCLGEPGESSFLDAQAFESLYGCTGISETPLDHPLSVVLNAWLDEREQHHRFSLYDASPGVSASGHLTPWALRCIEDADVVLLVGEARSDPSLSPVERALEEACTDARFELVLLHPSNCQIPQGTAQWLEKRASACFPLQAHHHVRITNEGDYARLAHRLASNEVGVALSGGGARGWAHVGVLRALEEAGVQVDWIAGASMGAIIASGYALDWSSKRLAELAGQFSDPRKLLDYTLPYSSITSTHNITEMLQQVYTQADIEDMWRPFFCISANLTGSREQIHTRGRIWRAVRASMAFPGIFAPILDGRNVLVDGGAANNLPLDRMREMCPHGTVIGVDLITSSPVGTDFSFGPSLSGWQALRGRMFPRLTNVRAPSLTDIVAGIVDSNNHYRLNETRKYADLIFQVPVQPFGLLEFESYEKIIEAGYAAASQQIREYGAEKLSLPVRRPL